MWTPSTLAVCMLSAMSSAVANALPKENPSLLIVGNAYSNRNNMDLMIKSLLEEAGFKNVNVETHVPEGEVHFSQYTEDSDLRKRIVEGNWTWVMFEEQREIPGLWGINDEYERSSKSLITLNDWVQEGGADTQTLLLLTWGALRYFFHNHDFYSSYDKMQDRISEGYIQYQELISTPDRPVQIAPAGRAFQAIHQDIVKRMQDPTLPSTDFSLLYENDDDEKLGFPSITGSFLTACVIVGTITGKDVQKIKWMPETQNNELSLLRAELLQRWASKTVAEFQRSDAELSIPPAPYVPYDAPSSLSSEARLPTFFFVAALVLFVFTILVFVVLPQRKTSISESPSDDLELSYRQALDGKEDDEEEEDSFQQLLEDGMFFKF